MKWPILIVLLFNTAFAGDLCLYIFRKNDKRIFTPDLDKVDKINRIESWSKKLRTVAYKNDPMAPTVVRKSRQHFKKVEEMLLEGDASEATHAYQGLFRRVEGNALVLQRYEVLESALMKARGLDIENYLAFLREEGVNVELAKMYSSKIGGQSDVDYHLKNVAKMIRKRSRKLGRDFDRYNHVSGELVRMEKAEYCSKKCKEAIASFRANSGLDVSAPLLKKFVGNRKSYTAKQVRDIFNSHPEAVLAARKKEFLQESLAMVKSFFSKTGIMTRVFTAIAETTWGKKNPFVKLIKGVYDARFEQIDNVIANRVSRNDLPPRGRYRVMENETAHVDQDSYFINHSRANDGRLKEGWEDVKKYAQENHPEVFQRMLEAEKIGRRLGTISKAQLRKVFKVMAFVGFGAGVWTYHNFGTDGEISDLDPEEQEVIDALNNYEPPVAPASSGEDDQAEDSDVIITNEDSEDPTVSVEYLGETDEELTDSLGLMHEYQERIGQ